MAQAKDENFPVASRVLKPEHRRHLLAVYGFARLVDDIGDEAAGDRLAQLDAVEADVQRIYAGRDPELAVLRPLRGTVDAVGLPVDPLAALIEANRQDQRVSRYETYDELVDYCKLSADPVGRIVLYVFGRATDERFVWSDRVCTALQIVEHLQDVAEDLGKDRIYLPAEDMARFGVAEADLKAPRASSDLRKLVAFEAGRATNLLRAGAPLVDSLRGRERLAVAGFTAGGRAALAAIAAADHDVLGRRPRPGKAGLLRELVRVLARKR
ncbi:squalene synthase HpnC [Yinghuangia seranimata]|uniref:squalene synthase HpnC n=1 Tax=Yinghuangia seranimata TaxID=408067 RepID=UPI00248B7A9B|nr:squalene synthase HpnC [Yinghuangia seranimata]MDI2125280.1 squalene synthase HpnC [Yinghuangia seranimata]